MGASMTSTSRHRLPIDRVRWRRHLSWPTAAAEVIRSDDERPLGLVVPVAHPLWGRIARILGAATLDEIDRIEQVRWFLRDEYLTTQAAGVGELSDGVWRRYVSWVVDQTDVRESEVMLRGQFVAALASLGHPERGHRIIGLLDKGEWLRDPTLEGGA